MPRPKKGPRFGRDPAHQRLIMANLAAHLFEAGHIDTTLPRAKALRPYAEHLITKAKHGGIHQRRHVIVGIHDQNVAHKLFAEIAPPLRRPEWWLPANSEAGSAPRRQRAHGAHRTGVSQLSLGSGERHRPAPSEPPTTAAEHAQAQARSRTTVPTFAGSPPSPTSAPSPERWPASSNECWVTRSSRPARGGPTRASTRGPQVVSCAVDASTDPAVLQRAINGHLAPEVVVRHAELVDGAFDARHSAQWRTYRYSIVRRDAPDPFRARYAWWVPEALDLARMRLASDPFLGEHDFSSFCRKRAAGSSTVRRVLASEWRDEGDGLLVYEIRATAFCWQMVRSIVGDARRRGDRQDPAR